MTIAIVGGGLAGVSCATELRWLRDATVVAAMHANDWDAADEIRAIVGRPWSDHRG